MSCASHFQMMFCQDADHTCRLWQMNVHALTLEAVLRGVLTVARADCLNLSPNSCFAAADRRHCSAEGRLELLQYRQLMLSFCMPQPSHAEGTA